MPKPTNKEPSKNSSVTQVVVAAIGAFAVLGAALFANWEKLLSHEASTSTPATASSTASTVGQPSVLQGTQGPRSPIVSGVGGNVTISMDTPSADKVQTSRFEGKWEARITDSDGNEYLSEFEIRVSGEAVTGSVTLRTQGSKLRDGKIVGNEIRFTTGGIGPTGADEIQRYRGVLTGEEIHFTVDIESSDKKRRTLEFSAEKIG